MPISYIAIIAIAVIAVILMIWVNKDDQPASTDSDSDTGTADTGGEEAATEPPSDEGATSDQTAFVSSVSVEQEVAEEAQEIANETAADPFKAPDS